MLQIGNPASWRGFLLGVCQRFVVTTAPCDQFARSELGQPQAARRARARMARVNVGHRQAAPAQGLFIARLPCRPPADLVSLAGVRSAVSLLKELADCPAWLCICRIADIFPFINTPASAIMRSPLLMIESHACSIVEDDVRRTVPLRRGARQGAGCQSRCGMEDAQTARG